MTQLADRGNAMGELLSEYAEFIDLGTINYLIDLMSNEEKKSKREIFKELEISRKALSFLITNLASFIFQLK